MAASTVTIAKMTLNELKTMLTASDATAVASDSTYGAGYYVKVPVGDSAKLLILFFNSHGTNAYDIGILAGTAPGATDTAIALSDLAAGGCKAIVVESAKYARDGYIIASGETTSIKVAALQLP